MFFLWGYKQFSLLPNQLISSMNYQENASKQEVVPLDSPSSRYCIPGAINSIARQDLDRIRNQDLISSEVDTNNGNWTENSELEVKYKQKRQKFGTTEISVGNLRYASHR